MAKGTAIVNFGAAPGSGYAITTVPAQANIATDSLVEAWIGIGSTADHNADEHIAVKLIMNVTTANIVVGSSFDIVAIASGFLTGQFEINWAGDWT